MKKLTTSILAVAMAFSFVVVDAQKRKVDTVKTKDIEGVVVTALGIKREKRALGYSTQEVKAEDIAKAPVTNFTSALSGKVSGLQVKGVGNFAGSVDVVLRGYRSISDSNAPLYVIDGIPVINANNNTKEQALSGRPGFDFGNTVSDINPNDIAEINVLKGAAATALYGARAQNGAIIITTKKGKKSKDIGLEFNSSVAVSSIDKTTFAKYQNQYGQGYGYYYGVHSNTQMDDYGAEGANNMAPTYDDASYGAAFDPNRMVWQYDSFTPGSANFGKAHSWVAAKHDPSYFFETGSMFTNDVSFSKGNDISSFRVSYQNQNGTDVLPNSKLNKNTLNGNATFKITDNLNASFGATYVSQQVTGRNNTGYSGNIISGFRQWWATNVDLYDQRDLYMKSGQNYTWNIASPDNLAPAYWNNPYFQRYENFSYDTRDRFAGNISLSYDVDQHINLVARVGTDGYNMRMEERKAIGSVPELMGFGNTSIEQPSGFAVENVKQTETNYDFIATYKNTFGNFNLTGLLGTNVNDRKYYLNSQSTSGGLYVPGIYTVSNSAAGTATPITKELTKQIIGFFGQASLGYANTYYLEGTLRRDTSSALPANNRSYWYYSGSGSMVFSNWDFLKGGVLSFGKLRASYAEVGSDTDADQLINRYMVDTPFGSTPSYYYNTDAKNLELKPQRSKQTELGISTQFLRNRFGFDVAWFQNDAYDQIIALPVSYATGFSTKWQNAGTLRTRGWEISVNLTPIKTENFKWDIDANWSNPITRVIALADGVENITLGSYQGGVTINASIDDLYGSIKGTDFVYTNGQKTVGSNGRYLITSNTNNVIGNIQAKWFGGITNTFTYKSLSVGFQIDVKQGGNVFSLDQHYGLATGLYPETVGTNDLGNPIRNTLANGGGVILPGVMADGSVNTTRVSGSNYGLYGYRYAPASGFIYDASYVKLRSASIAYSLPSKFLENTFVKGVTVSAIGNNLWIIKKHVPYADPEAGLTSGNAQGFQAGVMPTTRVISFNVKVNF